MPLHRASGRAGQVNQIVFRDQGSILGIVTLPPDTDIELLGLVHPDHRVQGIGRALLEAAFEECRRRGVADCLLVADTRASAGSAFASHVGANLEFSEILMAFDWEIWARESRGEDGSLRLDPAGVSDLDDLAGLQGTEDRQAARELVKSWLAHPANQIWIGRREGELIGMIRLQHFEQTTWINSFTVNESWRGQGLGRAMLRSAIGKLRPAQQVLLEVESDNEAALALYRSTGFLEQTRYGYYRARVG